MASVAQHHRKAYGAHRPMSPAVKAANVARSIAQRRTEGRAWTWAEAADEDVVDRPLPGRRRVEAEVGGELREELRVLGRPQVEVAAEDQRRAPRPPGRRFRGEQDVGHRQRRLVVGRVQVADADAGRGPREGHRTALRLARTAAPMTAPVVPLNSIRLNSLPLSAHTPAYWLPSGFQLSKLLFGVDANGTMGIAKAAAEAAKYAVLSLIGLSLVLGGPVVLAFYALWLLWRSRRALRWRKPTRHASGRRKATFWSM